MIFPTIEFAAFFVVVLTASWLLMPFPRRWKPFMLAASYLFYGYADWRFVPLLLAATVINQGAATLIARSEDPVVRKRVLVTAVVLDLGLLGTFKYLGFLVDSVDRLLTSVGLGAPLPLLRIVLPVGISFFTFQAISYVVDVYRRDTQRAPSMDVAVYLAFFPHLVAGPIVRAREFIPQLARPRNPRLIPAGPALLLIAGGLVKKVLIADVLATRLVDPVFGSPQAHSGIETLVAIYGYAVQIYCDFSGYTDMAIGLALLLGFRFPQNFDRPYAARSLTEFWWRWHMTLSRWLRDYLYIPLGGNRGGRRATYRNLMLTMLLGGLWHGAAFTFVIWGGIHGTGLAVERWWRDQRRVVRLPAPRQPETVPDRVLDRVPERLADGDFGAAPPVPPIGPRTLVLGGPGPAGQVEQGQVEYGQVEYGQVDSEHAMPGQNGFLRGASEFGELPTPSAQRRVLGSAAGLVPWLVTFHLVCFGWVFFRAPDLGTALLVLSRLVHPAGSLALVTPAVLLAIAVGLGVQLARPGWSQRLGGQFSELPVWAQGVALGVLIVLVNAAVGQQGVAPFLYFRF